MNRPCIRSPISGKRGSVKDWTLLYCSSCCTFVASPSTEYTRSSAPCVISTFDRSLYFRNNLNSVSFKAASHSMFSESLRLVIIVSHITLPFGFRNKPGSISCFATSFVNSPCTSGTASCPLTLIIDRFTGTITERCPLNIGRIDCVICVGN